MQQLNKIRNWSPRTGARHCIWFQGHISPPSCSRGCCGSPCYFSQRFEPLWDLRDTANVWYFCPKKAGSEDGFSSSIGPAGHARLERETSLCLLLHRCPRQLSKWLVAGLCREESSKNGDRGCLTLTWCGVKGLWFFSNSSMWSLSPGLQHLTTPALSKVRHNFLLAAVLSLCQHYCFQLLLF